MHNRANPGSETSPGSAAPRRPLTLTLLSLLLAVEALVLIVAVLWLLFELVSAQPDSFASAIALTVLTVVAAIWVTSVAVATSRSRPWVRGPALTWQLVQIAVAIGCFQGAFAVPSIGFAILIPSLAAIALLFTPSVVAATSREIPRDTE